MTARGSWPYAFLYHLHGSLMKLLPHVMTSLHATALSVVCPTCNTFDIDMAHAREAAARGATVRCWWCKHQLGSPTAFDVAGFASWETNVPDSELGSLVDAALELARLEIASGGKARQARIQHARDKLIG